jgi:hypothetical protein
MSRALRRPIGFLAGFAVLIFLVGPASGDVRAEDRGDLSLPKSLVGHWRTHSGGADYYFAEDGGLVMAEDEGGTRQEQTYLIATTNEDEEGLTVEIKVKSTGRGHTKELRFATDRESLMSTIRTEINGTTYVVNTVWLYVDEKQKPPPKSGTPEKK